MHTIAFHGRGGSGKLLKRDIGPGIRIDTFWDGFNVEEILEFLSTQPPPYNLLGYSMGGYVIAQLAQSIASKINLAVCYESPVFSLTDIPGDFPVLSIWNDSGRYDTHAGQRSVELWKKNHVLTPLIGKGGHVKWFPLGHNWDQSLNAEITEWIVVNTNLKSS